MIDPKDKRLIQLIGITYNQIENGVYAVILQEVNGSRRVPIIIGFPEAQSIECKLQEIATPRPLTHDLMVNLMSTFGIALREVEIYRLPSGVFAAELVLYANGERRIVDSRSSDAIALAIRVGAPIYTSLQVLDEVGFVPTDDDQTPQRGDVRAEQKTVQPRTRRQSVKELEAEMRRAAENEDYKLAARLKKEIDSRNAENNKNTDTINETDTDNNTIL